MLQESSGSVGNISTWIIAALRNEQFFTIAELNAAIRKKLEEFNRRPFQKKEGSRYTLFHDEELPLLAPLPATRYELAEWKQATVQFNYHIAIDGMLYSIPYEYIGKKVDVRITGTITAVKVNIVQQQHICPKSINVTLNGTAIVSVDGQKGLVITQQKS